jgi:hypothetical protein
MEECMRLLLAIMTVLAFAGEALAQSCEAVVGRDEAQTYVNQCLEVSPATHPPCNSENPCDLIWGEIERGCRFLAEDPVSRRNLPAFCSDYIQID